MKAREGLFHLMIVAVCLLAWIVPQRAVATFVDEAYNYSVSLNGSNKIRIQVPVYDERGADCWVKNGKLYYQVKNADGSYSYTATVSGTIWFVFASGLSSNWSEFNSNYRFGPISGHDETVEANTWVNTQHPNIGGDKAYEFVGTGDQYVFTFIPSAGISPTTAKFKINGTVKNPTIETRTVAGEPASVFGTVWDIYNSPNNMTTSSGVY
jgi:hypothetical protein